MLGKLIGALAASSALLGVAAYEERSPRPGHGWDVGSALHGVRDPGAGFWRPPGAPGGPLPTAPYRDSGEPYDREDPDHAAEGLAGDETPVVLSAQCADPPVRP